MKKNYFILLSIVLFYSVVIAGNSTSVVLLGTGTPNPDPNHSGPSVAVIIDKTAYIVDFGPGLVRKFAAITSYWGGQFAELKVRDLKFAFLTHLHSDHTLGYADLILTPWVMGRNEPLQVFGPEGTAKMTRHILAAYSDDIRYRLYGSEPANDQGWRVNVHEIAEGTIYSDQNVKVEAFHVNHGTWPNAFGFRFTTADKKIVISGDARPSENVIRFAQNADILIHEVYSMKGFRKKPDNWKAYHRAHHTSTEELAEIANRAKPKLLVLYHILFWGASEKEILAEIAEKYPGKVVVGRDLMVF